jgi:hypothetical protein
LEEDFDHLLQLREEEATGHWGATVYDNHSDSATHATPVIGSRQSLARGLTRSGRLEHWKGRKPSKFLESSPPRSIIDSGELPFQEGRPLASSNDDEGWVVSTKCFAPDHEVFMIHIDKDSEGLEYIQLDDYYINDDDYISDTPSPDLDAAEAFAHHDLHIHALDTMGTTKIEDKDNVQKERHKLRSAKRAACRQRILGQQQHQPSNLYDCSTSDLCTIINAGWDARNAIIARQQKHDLQPQKLSYPPQLPGYKSEMQARSRGTTNPKKENPQLEGTIRGGYPQVMVMALEVQALHLRMSDPSEGPESSATQQRLQKKAMGPSE